jgi:hypothetical protein
MVFLRNICINILQKGAKNDDDDDDGFSQEYMYKYPAERS